MSDASTSSCSRRSITPSSRAHPRDESLRIRRDRSHTCTSRGLAMRIAVCAPQVPFERGGAEIFADDLVAELRSREHEVDLVTVPYKWYPGERVLSQAFLWRLLDLDEADGRPIDLAIATKFPSYAGRHQKKVVC